MSNITDPAEVQRLLDAAVTAALEEAKQDSADARIKAANEEAKQDEADARIKEANARVFEHCDGRSRGGAMSAHSAFLRLLHAIFGHRWTLLHAYAPWEPTPHRRSALDCPFVYSCKCGKERVKHVKWD